MLNSSLEIKKEFLKALFDDEGSIIPYKRPIIRLYSINSKGLGQVQEILREFNIACKLKKGFGCKRNVYALVIEDLSLFYRQIGFNLKRKQEKLELCLKFQKPLYEALLDKEQI